VQCKHDEAAQSKEGTLNNGYVDQRDSKVCDALKTKLGQRTKELDVDSRRGIHMGVDKEGTIAKALCT